jgi:predicted transcriptional regulator with HTH domain
MLKLCIRLSGKPAYIRGALAGLIARYGGDCKVGDLGRI